MLLYVYHTICSVMDNIPKYIKYSKNWQYNFHITRNQKWNKMLQESKQKMVAMFPQVTAFL